MEWTKEKICKLLYNYPYYLEHKDEAEKYFQTDWKLISESASNFWIYRYRTGYIKSHWTEEEINELKTKYFYYLDHKDEAELHFKTTMNEIENKAKELKLKYINYNWTEGEIEDLKNNYSYYVEHIYEAKNRFRRKWKIINNKALKLGLIYNDWTEDKLKNLKENYSYYRSHPEEAEDYFKKSWSLIRMKASCLEILNFDDINLKYSGSWTNEELNNLKEKYFYYLNHKEDAENYFQRSWLTITGKASELEITSMKINKKCSTFLGCHVAERVLSHVFKDVKRMSIHNPGYDFICNKGKKIDSKSSCLHKNRYTFSIRYNKIADYFLCIGFDNRENLNPQHIWLIKSGEFINHRKLNNHMGISMSNSVKGLSKFSKYELTDKLKDTIECCNELKK